MKKIRAVLFDFGGVIAEEGFYNGLISLAEKQALDARSMPEEGMKAVYDSGFVLGKGTAADFWALMRQRTGLEGEDDFLSDRIIDGFQIRHWVIELVRKLRAKGYITGILSDQTHWLYELDSYDHFFAEFDHIYNSYDLGKGKRDATLFRDVVNNLKLQPGEVLFIDDNEGHVQRAIEMGLVALLYVDHKMLISKLEELLKEKFEE
jgi:putative hydrolase of the HAD superfamily